MTNERKPYPSDVTDDEWNFCVPYLILMKEGAPHREHSHRELFNGLRWLVCTGSPWRLMAHDLPPWHAVYQETRRWVRVGCFEKMAEDLRTLLRTLAGREAAPSAVIVGSRTIQSTPESGGSAGYDGAKKRQGSKVHVAVDTLGHLRALQVTAANEQDRGRGKNWRNQCKVSPEQTCNWRTWIKAARASAPAKQRRHTGLNLCW